ncbi:hypothetical protein [Dactylosporangium sp. CA-092794]
MIEDILRNGNADGIGKPERLWHQFELDSMIRPTLGVRSDGDH